MSSPEVRVVYSYPKSQIVGDLPDSCLFRLDSDCSFGLQGMKWMRRYWQSEVMSGGEGSARASRMMDWDGKVRLFSSKTKKFPTGLMSRVLKILDEYRVDYGIERRLPTYVAETPWLLDGITLRSYQEIATGSLLAAKRGIFWAPPRSGKTVVAASLIARAGIYPVLFICERLDLAYQNIETLERVLRYSVEDEIFETRSVPIGYVMDQKCKLCPVTVATIQSLCSAYDEIYDQSASEKLVLDSDKERVRRLVAASRVIVVDETHHVASPSYRKLLSRAISAEFVAGLSGTPWRDDGLDLYLEAYVGPVVYSVSYETLFDAGFLVEPTIYVVHMEKKRYSSSARYPTIYREQIVENETRNGVIKWFVQKMNSLGLSVMVLINQPLRHGNILKSMIEGSEFLHGSVDTDTRRQLLESLRRKELMCLVTTVGDEGLDIPSLDAVVVADSGTSSVRALQRMRCMTPCEGKKCAYVLDFYDHCRHLSEHSKCRLELYQSQPRFRVVEKIDIDFSCLLKEVE